MLGASGDEPGHLAILGLFFRSASWIVLLLALANAGGLSRYFWAGAPSIHIIVDNLHVTLKGYVDSEGDKNLAGITAKGVPGILSGTNNLQVVKQ